MKCSKCEHVWLQRLDTGADPGTAGGAVDAGDWDQRTEERVVRTAGRPRAPGRRGSPRAPQRDRRGGAGAWIVLLIVVIAIGGGAYWYRDAIMARLPATEAIYAAVGLGLESPFAGLDLIDVAWKQEETDGGAKVLRITGKVVNTSASPKTVPALSAVLYDGKNLELYRWTFEAPEPRLLPREDVMFKTEVTNPDTKAARLTIQFSDPKSVRRK